MRLLGWVLLDNKGKPVRKARKAQWNRPATTVPAALYENEASANAACKRFGGTPTKVYAK